MLKLIDQLLTARVLSITLVVEVGFIVGVYIGRVEQLSPMQWAGAAAALIGSALLAAMVHAWPKVARKKAEAVPARPKH